MGIRVSDTIPGIILVDWYSIWFIRAAFIPMLDRTPTRHVSAERYTYNITHKKIRIPFVRVTVILFLLLYVPFWVFYEQPIPKANQFIRIQRTERLYIQRAKDE